MLRDSTHLSLTVKSNLLGFKEMIAQPERAVDVDSPPHTPRGPSGRFAKHKIHKLPAPVSIFKNFFFFVFLSIELFKFYGFWRFSLISLRNFH